MSQKNLLEKGNGIKRNYGNKNFSDLKMAINEINEINSIVNDFSGASNNNSNNNNKRLRLSNSNFRIVERRRSDEELLVTIKLLNQSVVDLKKSIIILANKIESIPKYAQNNDFSGSSTTLTNQQNEVNNEKNNNNLNINEISSNRLDNQNSDNDEYEDSNNSLDTFDKIPSDEILEIYRESSSEYNFAVRLCKRVFKKSELINKNVYGKVYRKNEKKDALDPTRINYIKKLCLELCKFDDAQKFWAKCVVAINKMILQIPKNRSIGDNISEIDKNNSNEHHNE